MIIQLPNGRTVSVSIETYLSMSDDDFKRLNDMDLTGISESADPFDYDDDEHSEITVIETDAIEDNLIDSDAIAPDDDL